MAKSNKNVSKSKLNNVNDEKSKTNNKVYIGFNTRLFFSIFMFIILLIFGFVFAFKSLDFIEQKSINYSEKSNLDCKVYLKKNEFYSEEYLGKNMLYVASLIDKITIDFNYNFTSDENINLDFEYKIIGKLLITDSDEKNSYFEKEYVLLESKNTSITDGNNQSIKENIEIDYGYYNTIANRFKTSYGVDTSSKFVIYFVVNKDNSEENIIINNVSLMSISIPLSERAVNISMDYQDINNTNNIISNSNVIIDNIIYVIVAVIFIIISLVMLVKSIRLLTLLKTDKSNYDKYINKLLTEYDRLIVETSTAPITSGNNIIRINKFQELLDVRDNLKLPIMYYVVNKHQKCYFYITYENKIYLNVVKAIDLVENDDKKK